ncbi:MAG: hypothetical protein IJV24_03215 [Prevotella sp.]|nr:hypothetical protein [Prevotella sp.]
MSDIFDFPQKDQMQKDEIEVLDKQKHEFKLIGRERKVPGHTMFSFNYKTGEIKVAPIEHSKEVSFVTRGPVTKDRIVIEPDCIYRQALNKKNFIKRLVREGILVRKNHSS